METRVTPFLMFEGTGEEAMNLYVSLIPGSEVLSVRRYGPDDDGAEGALSEATFSLGGLTVKCADGFVTHVFAPTPVVSLFVTCQSEEELDRLAAALGDGGRVLYPPSGEYGYSRRFAWLTDRFGVSWQLNLP